MRPLFTLFVLLAGTALAQLASVTGVVVDQTTGQPIRGVHVRMVTGDFGDGAGINAVYGAISDAAGKFSAEGMKPGFYIVITERTGFLQVGVPGAPMAFGTLGLKADQHVTDFKLTMAVRATISGRVVDEYGDPVERVSVQTDPVPPDKPQESMLGGRNDSTNDRGEFRLVVAPGRYFVQAMTYGPGGNGEIRTDGTSSAPFVKTYFPSATDTAAASAIQAGAGQDVAGIEIRLVRTAGTAAPGRGLQISGLVTGIPDNGAATVHLRFGDKPEQSYNMRDLTTGPDGKFTFSGMQQGYYTASAVYAGGKTPLESRSLEFHLENGDQTNLQLVLMPGQDLPGTLEFSNGDAPGAAAIRLETAGGFDLFPRDLPAAAQVGKDGMFRLGNVLPGKFKVVVEPMPENAYLKEVALDGKAAAGGVLDFSQGVAGGRLKITVSRAGAQLLGKVLGKDGQPETGLMMVFLSTDPKAVNENSAKRTVDGTYSFQALAPGKYHLFALDVAQMVTAFAGDGNEEEIMKQFFDAADVIDIKEGDRVQKDTSALTKLPEKK